MICALITWAAGVVRIFWVCRVSLVNATTGVLFFWLIVQAQNLMADLSWSGSAWEYVFWALVFLATFLLWAFPVHYGARRSLDQLKRMNPGLKPRHRWLIRWMPRLLGLAPFAALAFGISGARDAAAGAAGVLPSADTTMAQGVWLYVVDGVAAVLFALFVYFRRGLVPASWSGRVLHPIALVLTAAIFATAYFAPLATSVHVPRALLVPPLFGSLVLLASWLTRLGDKTGFPFLAALALVLGVLTGLNAHFDDLRTIPNNGKDERLDATKAVERWKAANSCTGSPCPHPVVIAIDGGASRAAFTAATFVGELLDGMPKPRSADTEAQTPGRRIFAISGVSGGAYGAAVIQSALLDAQRENRGLVPPCRSARPTWFGYQNWRGGDKRFTWRQCLQALTSGDYLTSTIIGLAFRDFVAPPWQWIGLPPLDDRAAILEMTWERQYSATLAPDQPFFEGGDRCHPGEETGLCRRAAHPAAYVHDSPVVGAAPVWMPMLLLNGTSVSTGRRIISSDLASSKDGAIEGSLYTQAFDLREAMSTPCPSKDSPVEAGSTPAATILTEASRSNHDVRTLGNGVCAATPADVDGPDVRLSTAALISARFPVISPAGIFQMQSSLYGDQVVDGGYFENSGLTTALDVVAALKARDLDPIVVSISNNPAYSRPTKEQEAECSAQFDTSARSNHPFSPAQCTGLPRRPAETPLVPPSDNTFLGRFFGLLYRPFQTLVASGDGHSDELLAIAQAQLKNKFFHLKVEVAPIFKPKKHRNPEQEFDPPPNPECEALYEKQITMTKVSMSWWLAAAVQADLDIQRCAWRNRVRMGKIISAVAASP